MWCYCKMFKIEWFERITNGAVKVRRGELIGHLQRHDSLTKSVIECDVKGHIGRGRPRMEYTKQIMIDM